MVCRRDPGLAHCSTLESAHRREIPQELRPRLHGMPFARAGIVRSRILVLLLLTSCPGSTTPESDDGIAWDDPLEGCTARADTYLDALLACCAGLTEQEIEERVADRRDWCESERTGLEARFDGRADAACVDALAARWSECSWPEEGPAECSGIFEGDREVGETCADDRECGAGLYCDTCEPDAYYGGKYCGEVGVCASGSRPRACDDDVDCYFREGSLCD